MGSRILAMLRLSLNFLTEKPNGSLYLFDHSGVISHILSAALFLRGQPCQHCRVPEHIELLQVLRLDCRRNSELRRVLREHANLEENLPPFTRLRTAQRFDFLPRLYCMYKHARAHRNNDSRTRSH